MCGLTWAEGATLACAAVVMKCGHGCGFVTLGSIWVSVSVEGKPWDCEQREGEKENL